MKYQIDIKKPRQRSVWNQQGVFSVLTTSCGTKLYQGYLGPLEEPPLLALLEEEEEEEELLLGLE
jgi:hypothetical protein